MKIILKDNDGKQVMHVHKEEGQFIEELLLGDELYMKHAKNILDRYNHPEYWEEN